MRERVKKKEMKAYANWTDGGGGDETRSSTRRGFEEAQTSKNQQRRLVVVVAARRPCADNAVLVATRGSFPSVQTRKHFPPFSHCFIIGEKSRRKRNEHCAEKHFFACVQMCCALAEGSPGLLWIYALVLKNP